MKAHHLLLTAALSLCAILLPLANARAAATIYVSDSGTASIKQFTEAGVGTRVIAAFETATDGHRLMVDLGFASDAAAAELRRLRNRNTRFHEND